MMLALVLGAVVALALVALLLLVLRAQWLTWRELRTIERHLGLLPETPGRPAYPPAPPPVPRARRPYPHERPFDPSRDCAECTLPSAAEIEGARARRDERATVVEGRRAAR